MMVAVLSGAVGAVHAQTAAPATSAAAAPAQQRAQVPRYYRTALGDAVVIALYEGYVDLPAKTMVGMSAQNVQSLLARMFVSNTPGMQTAVNGYLIDTGSQRILVDTGAGTCFGPTMSGLAGNVHCFGLPTRVDRRCAADALAPGPRVRLADATRTAGFTECAGICGRAGSRFLAERNDCGL
jgi:hypothetical protein